jgi:hypothetical protein
MKRRIVARTSADVSSSPLWKLTPSLSVMVAVFPSRDHSLARPSVSAPPLPGLKSTVVSKTWFVTFATSPLVVCWGS